MTLKLASLLALIICSVSSASPAKDDPYNVVERFTLQNGLQVYFAPSATATTVDIEIQVATGTQTETAANRGVSHLLEHVLFRDKGLKDEMTYLQLIKEAGGSANGSTGYRMTNFYASIPPSKATWLFEVESKMILNPSFNDDYVQKEKGTIELERGTPGPITLALGFNPMDYARPKYLQHAEFDETEFGIPSDSDYTLSEEQLSTRKLSAEQVRKHYQDYYYPANMKIFVSGNYDRKSIMKTIDSTWAKLENRRGLSLPNLPVPKPFEAPFRRVEVKDGTPSVTLGTKMWGATIRDEAVADAYMSYLAHRLMKEIRNVKAQTYTANGSARLSSQGWGTAFLSFETQPEHLDENVKIAKDFIRREAQLGNISDDDIDKAIELYLNEFKLRGKETRDVRALAGEYAVQIETRGTFVSPYSALANIKRSEFRDTLKKYFLPIREYEFITRNALLFQYDYLLLYALSVIGSLIGLRKLLTDSFRNDHLRWIRNNKFPPLRIFEASVFIFAVVVVTHVNYFADEFFYFSRVLQTSAFFRQYLAGAVESVVMIAITLMFFCAVPRKLMIVDDQLWIKSMTYYSRRISLSEIAKVESVRPLAVLFSRKIWRTKHRYAYFHWMIWKKGTLIHLRNGKAYYFGVRAADATAAEINGFLAPGEPTTIERIAA